MIGKTEIIKLSISLKNAKALIIFDKKTKKYRVLDCSRATFCRVFISKVCPPYCEIVVSAKDFALKRRKPKAEVIEL